MAVAPEFFNVPMEIEIRVNVMFAAFAEAL
jgi:hypothetical protein